MTLERLAFWPVLLTSLVLASAMALLSDDLASIFHDPLLRNSFRLIAIAVPGMALGQLFRSQLRASEDVRLASVLEQVAIPGVNLIVVLAFALASDKAWALAPVLGYTIGQLLAAAGARFALVRTPRDRRVRSTAWKNWFGYGIPMWADAFVLVLLGYVDQLLLGHLGSTRDVGLYAPAVRLAALVGIPMLAVNAVFSPMVARFDGAGARDDLQRLYSRVNWGTAFVGLAAGVGLLAVGGLLLDLFGPEFSSSYPAFAVLVIGQIVATVSGCAGTVLTMTGWSKLRLANALGALTLNVVIGLALIPRIGLVGAAAGTSVSLAAINLVQVVEVRKLLGLTMFGRPALHFWMAQLARVRGG